ncbi:hemerythrin domain-containing protein [Sphingomonas sp. ID1715]|uniref:hemerythrin domain-containing protein n=1 Tax=Sphingomonas sp. ID1715 TaxID=1656898 RepID=UPI001488A674|nr:hemerythrin domain-containing protein [Sphingomonas sp. ID1715]NNM77400.1 hemerythrin domain-containing protein [Sphingomonas sp. ID1715]
MKKVAQVQIMCAQHQELRDVAQKYRHALAQARPEPQALADCRWRLMRLITGHIAYENAHLYPALPECGARAEALGKEMAAELGQLTAQLHAHVREWTAERIAADWSGYRAAAEALIVALTKRIDREEQELYPLLTFARAA